MVSLEQHTAEIVACRRCPRLVEYRERIALEKRRAYRECVYWGKPVPPFGGADAQLLIIGLAPAAHGGNRTGRMFTGDGSASSLARALYANGFASQPTSLSRDDGLQMCGAYVTAAVRCAPPANKPLPSEIRNCRPYLERELNLLTDVRVVVALGRIAFDVYLSILRDGGQIARRSDFVFAHDREHITGEDQPILISSYHPSQQNTSTGKLNDAMLASVFARARRLIERAP